jgi:plasmid stabilization system protein ParE
MAFEVVFTEEALEDYFKILNYLKSNWTNREVENFQTEIMDIVELIALFPEFGKKSIKVEYARSIMIKPYHKVYYEQIKDKIFILSIFDTRQNPE